MTTVTTLLYRRTIVTLLEKHQRRVVKTAFTKQISSEFKDYAIRELIRSKMNEYDGGDENVLPVDSHAFQTHHILPTAFGGSNHFDNLAWVHPKLHKQIHEEINAQTYAMQPCDTRCIRLPYKIGIVWVL